MDFVEAPPVHKRRALSQHWIDVVQALRDAPLTWALVGRYSPGTATGIRRGKYAAFLAGMPEDMDPEVWMEQNFEVTTRKNDDGTKNDVYIRFIG